MKIKLDSCHLAWLFTAHPWMYDYLIKYSDSAIAYDPAYQDFVPIPF